MEAIFLKIDANTKCRILKLFEKSFEDLQDDVNFIKKWLKTQPHLPEMPSDEMIEYFLVNNKFSLENTKQKIDLYYSVRTMVDEELGDINPKSDLVEAGFRSQYILPLPKFKDGLYRIIFLKVKEVPPELFNIEASMANVLNLYEIRMHEDLMFGDIAIFDFVNLKFGHIIKVTPKQVQLCSTVLEKLYSNRMKEIHVMNYPSGFDILMKLAKLFLKSKLFNRIHLHTSLQSLLEYIPRELLPKDYGGEQKSLDELEDLWRKKLTQYGSRFDKLEKLRVNNALRPTLMRNNNIFGVQGSFKRLNID